jgi:hypothetical protein
MRLIHGIVEGLRRLRLDDTTPVGAALGMLLRGECGSLAELADSFTETGLLSGQLLIRLARVLSQAVQPLAMESKA